MKEDETKSRRLKIKNYLELDNVSFLVGAGASYHLGCATITDFPRAIEDEIPEEHTKLFENVIRNLQRKDKEAPIDRVSGDDSDIQVPYEKVLDYLSARTFAAELCGQDTEKYSRLIAVIKKGLFSLCNTQKTIIHEDYKDDPVLSNNRYVYHEQLVKKLLQRPTNLRRANVFTTNYDLAFEHAFDNLAVQYMDGFSGFHKRFFKPETFEYDIYYPGSTTSGRVHRAEKVIKYFKLHGSLSWSRTNPTASNIYGLEELPLSLVTDDRFGDMIIYPCSTKKAFALDLPYSELFRQFALAVTQSQSVLFTLGYSFNDEHINDIIRQALSVPSFTLIIVDYKGRENKSIDKLLQLEDPRIMLIDGDSGKFVDFVSDIMPDLYESNIDEKVAETLSKLAGITEKRNE